MDNKLWIVRTDEYVYLGRGSYNNKWCFGVFKSLYDAVKVVNDYCESITPDKNLKSLNYIKNCYCKHGKFLEIHYSTIWNGSGYDFQIQTIELDKAYRSDDDDVFMSYED